jgi:alanyl aminopeptidase
MRTPIFVLGLAYSAVGAQAPGDYRLPAVAKPLAYELDLTIDPSEDTYSGVVRIDTEILRQTDMVHLHSVGLEISRASVGGAEAKLVGSGIEMVGLRLPSTRKPGRALIEIACKRRLKP